MTREFLGLRLQKGYCFYMNSNIWEDFQICNGVPLNKDFHSFVQARVA